MRSRTGALAFALAFASSLCVAQGYPNRPVRLVITYPPGGRF